MHSPILYFTVESTEDPFDDTSGRGAVSNFQLNMSVRCTSPPVDAVNPTHAVPSPPIKAARSTGAVTTGSGAESMYTDNKLGVQTTRAVCGLPAFRSAFRRFDSATKIGGHRRAGFSP